MAVQHGVNFHYQLARKRYERSPAAEGGRRARPTRTLPRRGRAEAIHGASVEVMHASR
jgi:hypothetical protein